VNALGRAIAARRVLVCVGAGGVGKTTLSATLALLSAAQGKKALVCTIDPARRLANSLGLKELGNEEAVISRELLEQAGVPPKAELRAMMLDMKRSWDEMIGRFAAPESRSRILENRYYQTLSTTLAGSQEYIALDKMWELRHQRDYGMIVLDTPPTAHALDFLDAPNRILDFLDNDAARWLLAPALKAGKLGFKLFNFGGSFAAKTLSRLTGTQLLADLADFMFAISGMYGGFRERAKAVREMLASPETSFVLVTTPHPERLAETIHFHELLKENRMDVAAVVVNRVHTPVPEQARSEVAGLPEALKVKLEQTFAETQALADHDRAAVETLRARVSPTPLVEIPRFDLDVHDVKGLWTLGQILLGEATPAV
jgi:anion-transporting  ArsA/GET3 family ATPase